MPAIREGLGVMAGLGRLFAKPVAWGAKAVGASDTARNIERAMGRADSFKTQRGIYDILQRLQGSSKGSAKSNITRFLSGGKQPLLFRGRGTTGTIHGIGKQPLKVGWDELPSSIRKALMENKSRRTGVAQMFSPNQLGARNVSAIQEGLKVPGYVGAGTLGAGGVGLGYGLLGGEAKESAAYVQGFVEKCAELGVDPGTLIK